MREWLYAVELLEELRAETLLDAAGGRVSHAGVGILACRTFGNRNACNHIHNLGHGWLSDIGGLYTRPIVGDLNHF